MVLRIPFSWVKIGWHTENQRPGTPPQCVKSNAWRRAKVSINNGQLHIRIPPRVQHTNYLHQDKLILLLVMK